MLAAACAMRWERQQAIFRSPAALMACSAAAAARSGSVGVRSKEERSSLRQVLSAAVTARVPPSEGAAVAAHCWQLRRCAAAMQAPCCSQGVRRQLRHAGGVAAALPDAKVRFLGPLCIPVSALGVSKLGWQCACFQVVDVFGGE